MSFDIRLPISLGTERLAEILETQPGVRRVRLKPLAEKRSAAQRRRPLRRAGTGAVSPVVYWVPTTLFQPSTMFLIAAEKAARFDGKCSLA